jgi:hypothetical protein
MKKMFALICSMLLVAGAYAFVVNEKVLKSFSRTFNNAENVKWEEFKDYYTVSFVHAGIRSKVNYDRQGKMLGSIRYYAPNMLPLNVYNTLKTTHPDKKLFGVTEITFGNEMVFFVKMEDSKHWTTIKIDNEGNSSVYEKYKKA